MTADSKNVVASVLARLRNVAESGGLSFNDILQSYVIERFLARLARSSYADGVLLKGALMLRVWGVPRARPTMDIDLLRRGVADQASLVQLVADCAVIEDSSDGVITAGFLEYSKSCGNDLSTPVPLLARGPQALSSRPRLTRRTRRPGLAFLPVTLSQLPVIRPRNHGLNYTGPPSSSTISRSLKRA
jgi:hypothetical protein